MTACGKTNSNDTWLLLVQLGTPDAPTPAAVRRYLAEFLSDERVVDLPRWQWLPLLYGVILPRRSPRSAALYGKIWRSDGRSPLLHTTEQLSLELGERLLDHGVTVHYAMRYGTPSLRAALQAAEQAQVKRLLVLPLYPQYASSTTGSTVEMVFKTLATCRFAPTLRVAEPFYQDAGYIQSLATVIRPALQPDELLLLSFHGLPQRHVDTGDPYGQQCQQTAQRLVERLGLPKERWRIAFQSRFGREAWLEPATAKLLSELPKQGIKRVAITCPGFVADCLETLEEIAQGCKETFIQAGGEGFNYIPCLNTEPVWLESMEALVRRELAGWIKG